jgi:hypothetical protein
MELKEPLADLYEVIDGCLEAIDEEVCSVRDELVRRGISEPLVATAGREIDSDGTGILYEWELPAGKYVVRQDDAVRVECDAGETLGFVASFDTGGPVVRISATEWLGRRPGQAVLTFDPTWLLGALAARLQAVGAAPTDFHPATALSLFGIRFPRTGRRDISPQTAGGLNASQREALSRILGSAVQFVWGPPGTGKTRLLGHAVADLAAEGRVLVLAMTNVAVDEAAQRVVDRLGHAAVLDGRVIRVGAAFSDTGSAELSLEAAVERAEGRYPTRLTRVLDELEAELLPRTGQREEAPGLRSRYARLVASLRDAHDPAATARAGRVAVEFQRAAARALTRADVVLTTFARLTVRDDLAAQRFKCLVIDEASSAPLPYVLVGASVASEKAVVIGDFQQLPAVVSSRGDAARRWLSRDIFRQAGVVDPGSGARDIPAPHDTLCAMLSEQYRMRPAIRALVSDLFYGGRLADAPEVVGRDDGRSSLLLVDTTSLSPVVEQAEGSRTNPVHVEAIVRLLEVLARAGLADVGVVTPYRLQARRLLSEVRARLGRAAPDLLEVSTIHRFQGREKKVMILDTVDAPPRGSWFLNEDLNPDFPRLLNVALSRSRDLLVVVGTLEGLRQTLPVGALLNRVVDHICQAGVVVDGRRVASLAARHTGALAL